MARTISTRAPGWLRAVLAALVLTAAVVTPATAVQIAEEAPPAADGDSVVIGQVELRVETGGSVTTASLATAREDDLRELQATLTTVIGHTPADSILLRFAGTLPDDDDWSTVTAGAVIDDNAAEAVVLLDPFLALSDTDARNLLRTLASRFWLVSASERAMPASLVDGFARYLQEPVLARQAREASFAQQAYLDGTLPAWSEIISDPDATVGLDQDAAAASRLAVAAFLIERYGASMVGDLATRFAADPGTGATEIVEAATGQPSERLDAAWEDFVTLWFAGGWRTNAFAALDLAPAEDLLARGAYEAAADRANQTLQVTTSLDDPIASVEAEMLVAQGSVGMQAEALMRDAEEALRHHQYARASTLIDRAADQYALLPGDHRPDSLMETWRGIADDGIVAIERLQAAAESQNDWFAMRESRQDAVAAGVTFARLGDTERLVVAQELVDQLDERFVRLVLALGAAIIILIIWLVVWSWNRAPGRVRWPGLADLAHEGGAR
jgi:hypothetical protein